MAVGEGDAVVAGFCACESAKKATKPTRTHTPTIAMDCAGFSRGRTAETSAMLSAGRAIYSCTVERSRAKIRRVKYWEIIASNLSKYNVMESATKL